MRFNTTLGQFIFYGAGQYARKNLETWLIKGLIPACFADKNKTKHHTKIRPHTPTQTEFEVLPFQEALELYPDVDIYITINREADPESYEEINDYIISHGISSERVGMVPETPTGRKCIFYGAGLYANLNLKQWVFNGIEPVCFVDSNKQKHYTKMRIPPMNVKYEFDILPVNEAMEHYPEAFLYITTDPKDYDITYDDLIAQGVPVGRIGAPPQHCKYIGHRFLLKDPILSYCCEMGYSVNLPVVGNIKEDIQKYYTYCENLRKDLNLGKLTSCTGCPKLRKGRSDEQLRITDVILDSGVPGATKCNLKCCYCFHGMNFLKKTHERSENVLDILQYLGETEDISTLSYAAAEITVSQYKLEILKLLKESKWKGEVLTNAVCYVEELKDLLGEKSFSTTISIDSGTPETFAKVKGADCFEMVVKNVEKYASSGGEVKLKYIVMNGMNCGKLDLDGFIEIAKKTNSEVVISWDMRNIFSVYSNMQYKSVSYLAKQCILWNIPYTFSYNTPEYIKRLKKDGLYPVNRETK